MILLLLLIILYLLLKQILLLLVITVKLLLLMLLLPLLAIGVDLGTTFSVVGINRLGEVIIIEDKQGKKIFPSVVSFLDNGGFYYI